MAVHQKQDAASVVSRQCESADTRKVIGVIEGREEPSRVAQRLGQGSVTVLPDILLRDDSHAGGRISKILIVQRGSLNFDLHQLVEIESGQILAGLAGVLCCCVRGEKEQK